MSRELGISKTPLKEAMIRLECEGFVNFLPRRGVRVRGLTGEELKNFYEIIGYLEAGVVGAVFERLRDGGRRAAAETLECRPGTGAQKAGLRPLLPVEYRISRHLSGAVREPDAPPHGRPAQAAPLRLSAQGLLAGVGGGESRRASAFHRRRGGGRPRRGRRASSGPSTGGGRNTSGTSSSSTGSRNRPSEPPTRAGSGGSV